MLSNKFGGIAGAAMLGTAALLGTNAANAVIDLEAETKDDPVVTFAMETLEATADDDDMYYVVVGGSGDASLDVQTVLGVAGAGGANDDLIVTFNLDGMIFTEGSAIALAGSDGVTFGVAASGGKDGDDSVVYTAKRGTGGADSETELNLTIAQLGVMPNGAGTISATTVNPQQRALLQNIPGVDSPGTHTASYEGAVAVANGLKPTATPMSVIARVESSFQNFGTENADNDPNTPETPILMANLGTFMLGVDPATILVADDGSVATLSDLIDVGSTNVDDVETGASSVTITGDFSFAGRAWLDDADCGDTDTGTNDLLKREDGKVTDTEELEPQTPGYVNANPNVCVMARAHTDDDPISIPETTIMVKTTYKPGTEDAAFPPGDGTHDLGTIERNGTTVRFPYLTTREGYVQRIRIVSRAPDGAKYAMSFADNAEATDMAEGTLDKGRNTLMVSDMVTVNEGSTTSGDLVIEASPSMIDIASTLNTPGSTDTVLH